MYLPVPWLIGSNEPQSGIGLKHPNLPIGDSVSKNVFS